MNHGLISARQPCIMANHKYGEGNRHRRMNSERSIIRVGSDISEFSRGTVSVAIPSRLYPRPCGEPDPGLPAAAGYEGPSLSKPNRKPITDRCAPLLTPAALEQCPPQFRVLVHTVVPVAGGPAWRRGR